MFDLASAENAEDSSVAPSGNSPSMVLYDNSDELAILFYFLYRYPVDYENTKNCLQPTLLAHKYDISNLVGICRNQITSQLSGDDSSDGYEAVLKYRRDRTLIPLALRAAQLVEIPNIIPWALYMLSVQLDSDHYLFEQSEQDSLLVQCYAAAIHKLRNLFSKLIDWWNDEAAKFMGGDCEADGWDCARRYEYSIEYGDIDDSMFTVKAEKRPQYGRCGKRCRTLVISTCAHVARTIGRSLVLRLWKGY